VTAVVRHVRTPPPPATRAGLVLPGLGHLLVGDWTVGVGLLAIDVLLIWSAIAGFPRIGTLLFGPGGALMIHPVVALASWPIVATLVWRVAMRRAYPRPMSEEEEHSNGQLFLRTFRRHRTGMLGMFGVLFMLVMTLLTPLIAPYDPVAVAVGPNLAPPSAVHLMGTDEFGRDVFSRLLYGSRISLAIGFVAVGIAASVGTLLGSIAGYVGGAVDRLIMFFVDVMLSYPRLILLLAIVGLFRPSGVKGIFLLVTILGFTAWMGIARIVRSEILSLKQRDFVQAAVALGLSSPRILFVHLIPNALAPVIVYCSLAVGGTMLAEAGLSFLGLGVPPPIATWGVMVNDGRDPLRAAPWISTFPGIAIMISVLSFNLLGDGLRDALDPKLRG
jgi:peptide/nickel transport system permease protein